eukprot:gene15301-18121_t
MFAYFERFRTDASTMLESLFKAIPQLRLSFIAHGDYCDDLIDSMTPYKRSISILPFTSDRKEIMEWLNKIEKTDGGDAPELYEHAQLFYEELAVLSAGRYIHIEMSSLAKIKYLFAAICLQESGVEPNDETEICPEMQEFRQMFDEPFIRGRETINVRFSWWDISNDIEPNPRFIWNDEKRMFEMNPTQYITPSRPSATWSHNHSFYPPLSPLPATAGLLPAQSTSYTSTYSPHQSSYCLSPRSPLISPNSTPFLTHLTPMASKLNFTSRQAKLGLVITPNGSNKATPSSINGSDGSSRKRKSMEEGASVTPNSSVSTSPNLTPTESIHHDDLLTTPRRTDVLWLERPTKPISLTTTTTTTTTTTVNSNPQELDLSSHTLV